MTAKPTDHWHMKRALRLAQKAAGWTFPNPMVGAVLVHEDERIGEAFHQKTGEPHAEVLAIEDAIEKGNQSKLSEAKLYVTLEPCCHQGKTPPCIEAIIEAKIPHVIIGAKDPSAKVDGKGIQALKDAGIKVELGICKEEARLLNKAFYTFHEKKRPWVTLKAAISLDGSVGYPWEQSLITGKEVQKRVHLLRHLHHGILIGAGTLNMDNPHLGVRLIEGRDPIRILMKGDRDLPEDSLFLRDENHLILEKQTPNEVCTALYEKGIQSILIEGGPSIFTAFLKEQLVDEIHLFIAPKVFGEKGLKWNSLQGPLSLKRQSVQKWGSDTEITLQPQWDSSNS
jgi:diaminohydroxyphosphoribosylaminopyrimidine deaminase/5-amino-6-(5-phosphoribosylamino)uracil reductase